MGRKRRATGELADVRRQVGRAVADIAGLAARFSAGPCVLVAHDWGGALAWGLAIARPALLSHLVIVNAPHPYTFWRELAGNAA